MFPRGMGRWMGRSCGRGSPEESSAGNRDQLDRNGYEAECQDQKSRACEDDAQGADGLLLEQNGRMREAAEKDQDESPQQPDVADPLKEASCYEHDHGCGGNP